MKTLLVPTPEGKMTEEDVDDMFPEKPEGWQFEIGKRHLSPATVPDAIVVQVRDAFQPSHVKAMIQRLAHLQTGNPGGSFIVFALRHQGKGALQRARARRERFEAILDKIRD